MDSSLAKASDVEPLQPQVIVVQVGINDLKAIPLFLQRKARIIANCQENIAQIVAHSTDLRATTILTTIFAVGKVPVQRRPFWSDDVALAVDEVNAYIRSLEGQDVIVFDAFSVLADHRGHDSLRVQQGSASPQCRRL